MSVCVQVNEAWFHRHMTSNPEDRAFKVSEALTPSAVPASAVPHSAILASGHPAAVRSEGPVILAALGDQRAQATIDLSAIAHNVSLLKSRTSSLMMAVVKADGYGHGAVESAGAALAGGADWIGVALPSEALQLREAGIAAPILAWLWPPAEDIGAALRADVTIAVSTLAQLDAVATSGVRTADIHLKLDTGMGRNGSSKSDWTTLCRAAAKAETAGWVTVSGLLSHLASADLLHDPSVAEQTAAFIAGIGAAREAGLKPSLCHLANSAAVLLHPETHFDMVRCGIAIYGLDPTESYSLPRVSLGLPDSLPAETLLPAMKLRPAMTLRAQVVLAKRVPAGHGVSYGLTYRTGAETTLALVPLGYADGIPRAASGSVSVSVGGATYPVVGRIAMDQMVIDVGDAVVMAGDEVIIFGNGSPTPDGVQVPTAKDWAVAANTIDYEIVTRISSRVPRGYLAGSTT